MWDVDYDVPEPRFEDYGFAWPTSADGHHLSQVAKELAGFKDPGVGGFGTRYEHGLRLLQLLWPGKVILYRDWKDYRTGETVRIWNWYFMEVFKACCEERRVVLTGCASSSKTYAVACYSVLVFMAHPSKTTVMVSTTAQTDAERRVWGDVKDLHSAARAVFPVGTLLPYLTAITFDPKQELENRRDATHRDLGCGIMVIPIPQGKDGENAVGKIVGTKNERVVWIAEEMPYMIKDFQRPESNLESNPFYQFIGTGNANDRNDAHGEACKPDGGWGQIDIDTMTWRSRGAKILFLNGLKSPNMHPAVDPGETDKLKLPFPYLMNRIAARNIAVRKGYGATEDEQFDTGSKTRDYVQMAVGFWPGDAVESTLLNREFVRACGADQPVSQWAGDDWTPCAGFDPAFSAGGDSNELLFGKLGRDKDGLMVLELEPDTVSISVEASDRVEFREKVARRVAMECAKRKVKPENVYMDISGDGGLMLAEIGKVWGICTGISSLEKTGDEDDTCDDIVTKLWFQARKAVENGRVRGFNTESRYAADLFARRYETVGKGRVKIEPKGKKSHLLNRVGFRQRMGRSPDAGDAGVLLFEGAKRLGLPMFRETAETAKRRLLPRFAPEGWDEEEGGQVSLEAAAASEGASWSQGTW